MLLSALLLSYFYQDEIKKRLVDELNKQINTEISISSINFSVLKKFPNASIELTNVLVKDAWENKEQSKDTLLFAEKFSLQMSLFDLFKKNYEIKNIELNQSAVSVKIDKSGNNNLHVFKENETDETSSFKLNLQRLIFKNIDFEYQDKHIKNKIVFSSKELLLNGNFSEKLFDLTADGNISVQTLNLAGVNYLNRRTDADIELVLAVNAENSTYQFKKSQLMVAKQAFDISGVIKNNENQTDLNIHISGKNMDIQSVLSLLPEQYNANIKDYKSEGNFYFNMDITGKVGKYTSPSVDAEFGIKNATVLYMPTGTALKAINTKGYFTTGKKNTSETFELMLENFSANMNNSKLSGTFYISNFSQPKINVETVSEFDLAEWKSFFQIDTIADMSGKIIIDARFEGKIRNPNEYTAEDFRKSRTAGKVSIQNASLLLKNNPKSLSNVNAEMLFDNNDIIVNSFSANIQSSSIALKGFFRNILSFFFIPEQKLVIDAKLNSSSLNLNELLAENTTSSGDTTFSLKFSERANLYLNVNIDKLNFRKFNAESISGKVVLKDNKLFIENVTMNTMQGNATVNGLFDAADENEYLITIEGDVNKINIQDLFIQCENFGQELLQAKHLKGTATSHIQFIAATDKELQLKPAKVYTNADLTIENGELIKFEPVYNLSRFINLSELEHIKFGLLQTQIVVKERVINIAKTSIASSALNLEMSGKHTFDNIIDYGFKVMLNELLSQKAKKAKKENEEYLEDDDEGGKRRMALFISMKGTVDNPKFSYDKVALTNKIKQDVKQEKQTVKSLLKEEFGMYKSDTTLGTNKEIKPVKLQVEWEEASKKDDPKKPDPRLQPSEKTKFDKWLDKIAPEEKKKTQAVEIERP
ncbi:MAG: AsmA-like C-terminal region-containing protein [Bacteroidia bacterium]